MFLLALLLCEPLCCGGCGYTSPDSESDSVFFRILWVVVCGCVSPPLTQIDAFDVELDEKVLAKIDAIHNENLDPAAFA